MAKFFAEEIIENLRAMDSFHNSEESPSGSKFIYTRKNCNEKQCMKSKSDNHHHHEYGSSRRLTNPQMLFPISNDEGVYFNEPGSSRNYRASAGISHSEMTTDNNSMTQKPITIADVKPKQFQDDCFDCHKQKLLSKHSHYHPCIDQYQLDAAKYCERSSLMRSILGPFPDETIVAAIDKFLTIIGLAAGVKRHDLRDLGVVDDCANYIVYNE